MAEALYDRLMTGGTGDPFDRHVLACVVTSGFAPPGRLLTDTTALSLSDLRMMMDALFPHALGLLDMHPSWQGPKADAPEEPDLRALLYEHRTPDGDPAVARWLARIIARRSLAERHLWEDLGLASRDELTRLMDRHFAPLAARNPGMRWKKFFYRTLCEQEGVLLCKAPNCQVCEDYALCFAA
ncbi:nitrogen fixation protein NifQ [Roseospira navarrensis]|uniref:Nitrogen fixation protein NifQ n=1 Tax=Roseospira navarrensis TaxID=140058 RepID=A0A7X1ZI05_9PROT|nr:nitrogen fixation protein NifQ [Roseospira navarrensis]MQX37981.1 nitrogen fixation protein NifQ [Roseospira navarrensis]